MATTPPAPWKSELPFWTFSFGRTTGITEFRAALKAESMMPMQAVTRKIA
jgi:hypothetical protein